MLIRPATGDDVADIEHIVKSAYSLYVSRIGREPAPMGVDYRRLVTETDEVWVAVDDGAIVGLLVTIVESDHLLIENIAVAPHAQGRGYSRRLLAHAEQQARDHNLAELRLYTNAAMTENLTLYPHFGYVEVDRRTEDGFDRVYFVKDLRR